MASSALPQTFPTNMRVGVIFCDRPVPQRRAPFLEHLPQLVRLPRGAAGDEKRHGGSESEQRPCRQESELLVNRQAIVSPQVFGGAGYPGQGAVRGSFAARDAACRPQMIHRDELTPAEDVRTVRVEQNSSSTPNRGGKRC